VVLGGLVVAALTGALDGLTLDTDGILLPLALASAVLVPLTWFRPSRRWLTRTLPIVLAVVAVGVCLLAWYVRASQTIRDIYPQTFLLWIFLALATLATVIVGWRRGTNRQRAIGLIATPVVVAAAFVLINTHYGYWPTLGDLLGHPVVGQVSAGTLQREIGMVHREDATASRDPHFGATHASLGHATSSPSSPIGRNRIGQFAVVDIPATVSHFHHRPAGVYLPPAYFTSARRHLPVLIMLAGAPSGPATLATAGGALVSANRFAAAHDGLAPVMLFPDANGTWLGDTECVNGPRGQAETYLTVDVVRYAVDVLHLGGNPDQWGVVGFSEGGTCALDLSLRHPNVFHDFVDLAGDAAPNMLPNTLGSLYGGSVAQMTAHDPALLMANHRYPQLTGWFASGRLDWRHVRLSIKQCQQARKAGVHAWVFVGPGAHGFQFTTAAIRRVMPALFTGLDPHGWHPNPKPDVRSA
jgi:S-formylglutathione hydrolase FrmB